MNSEGRFANTANKAENVLFNKPNEGLDWKLRPILFHDLVEFGKIYIHISGEEFLSDKVMSCSFQF